MNNILRDYESSVNWASKRKKKEPKRQVIKKKKVAGEPHINHVGTPKSGVLAGPDCRCQRLQCFTKISGTQQKQLFQDFYNYQSKDDQDVYLAGLISYQSIQQRRPRVIRSDEDEAHLHEIAYRYIVRIAELHQEVPVCATAFMNLHGITRGRLRTIQSKILSGQIPKDQRGKHDNRPHKIPEVMVELIKLHIKSFKARQSHYSLRDNPAVIYLPAKLSVSKMLSLFLNEMRINITYGMYYHVFTTYFSIKFGLPRSHTCSICDELSLKIKSASNDELKNALIAQKKLHLQKAKKFRDLKATYKQKAQRGECMLISFDYMQNLPLPHIQTSDVFFSRQLWYYCFGIHDLANDAVSMYCYTETTGKKGSSDVTSLLLHYLNNREITSENLVLISDGCGGQNKNHVMVYFQYFLVHVLKIFKSVIHIFPIRGHTYLPNDADFALIGHKKKKCGPEVPADWNNIIKDSRYLPTPFKVIEVTQDMLFDIKDAVSPFFLRTPKPALQLRKVRIIKMNAKYNYVHQN